jgi:hypothetical protein
VITPPFADVILNPVLSAVVLSVLALTRMPVTIKNLEANEARMRIVAGIIKIGINDISIRAPIEMKNAAANMSLEELLRFWQRMHFWIQQPILLQENTSSNRQTQPMGDKR